MRLALGQINSIVGNLDANASNIERVYNRAVEADAQLVVFPELSICGYPPEDLLHKKHFLEDNRKAINQLTEKAGQGAMIVGFAEPDRGYCHNSAAVLRNGKIEKIYRKGLLPNFGVFDETRYFEPGNEPVVIEVDGQRVAITICRDIWEPEWLIDFLRPVKPFELLVNISASPFHVGKINVRRSVISSCASKLSCAIAYCNLIGGQDELVFDGRSMAVDSTGRTAVQAKAFEEHLLIIDINSSEDIVQVGESYESKAGDVIEEIYKALVLGTKDYFVKNGFSKALIGLSGGIDSSVVVAIATEALGKENVIGITMPSRFNIAQTRADAAKLAENLNIEFHSIPISNTLEAFDKELVSIDGWDNKGLAYENLQARIRGTILMSLSNQFGALVLTTGNKSETAVGYSTLYGDTAGGFAVIKDVPKTLVYKLAEYINESDGSEVIPTSVITRPPSAELRDDQKDSDSLPDYDVLDRILEGYVELDKSATQLIKEGLDEKDVLRAIRLVDCNEYKRRQSPPGVKITPKAFGKDRRMPIANQYKTK